MGNLCSLRSGADQLNAGSILDRVISQSSDEDQCLLYRLANYKKGGDLIEVYNRGGQPEVERVIREQFGALMYADGKGQSINRAEYLRWKFRDLDQVVLPIEASLSRFDPLARWSDHNACWQMQYRGSLGETLLHVLIICDTRAHTRIARIMLKCFPRLAIDVVEGEEYLGASALHLAIAYDNNELVQDLVEAGADVSQRAIGSFFLPRDQQKIRPARNTDYEGLAYLGEYPLAWAACCANESVYNLLIDSGADPDEQDSFGNMILHMVVVCDKLDMFGYALRHPKLPARNGIVNAAGLTPLTLACQLGRAEVFREMLELSAREFWRYSNITCSAYPLNALDTLLPDGRTNWNSALFIILNGTKEEHLDMLDGGIIQRLLEEKWKTFARLQFLKRLIILVFHLTSLSLAVYFRPATDRVDADLNQLPEEISDIVRAVAECVTILGVLSYILVQLGGEIVNIGFLSFFKQLSHEPAKFIFLISNILILCCIPYRISGNRQIEDAILVVAVPGSWFLLMFFAGAVRLTGPFVTMVYSMITGDMLTFGIIYMVVLFGFSQSFYFLYKGFPGVKGTLYHSYHSTWMALFQITLGDYSYSDLSNTAYPNLSKTVFAIFMVLVPILLLNMLIAMMGNTYAHVIEQSEKEWMKQWAKIVVSLERAVSQDDAHNYLQEYSIKLGPGDDPNDPASEQRGVMVIKSKSKTRAKQRKGAVANWKRVGKVTISELKKRGITGEDLRRIMWGRASFSTPVKASPLLPVEKMTVSSGFGEALTAALDVIDMTQQATMVPSQVLTRQVTTEMSPLAYQSTPLNIPSDPRKPHTLEKAKTKNRLNSVEWQENLAEFIDAESDPLLGLVIASENPSCDVESLMRLARLARISAENAVKTQVTPGILNKFAAANFGLVADQNKSKAPSQPTKKHYFVESSDNEVAVDSQLGMEARLKRIRLGSTKLTHEKRKYSQIGGESSSSLASAEEPCLPTIAVASTAAASLTQSIVPTSSHVAAPQIDSKTTVPATSERIKRKKLKSARNRIYPKEQGRETPDTDVKQVHGEMISSSQATSVDDTDPLEPWSMRDIKDMNTILDWKEPRPDSP